MAGLLECVNPTSGPLLCSHCNGCLIIIKAYCMHPDDRERTLVSVRMHDKDGAPTFSLFDENGYPPWDDPGPGVAFWLGCRECKREHSLVIYYVMGRTKIYWRAADDPGPWLLTDGEEEEAWEPTSPPKLHIDRTTSTDFAFGRDPESHALRALCYRVGNRRD